MPASAALPGVPEISVIVCSHNGERNLGAALDALNSQSLAKGSYEVIVVDDGSSDGTAALAAAEGARVKRLETNQGIAAARNAGVEIARAGIVAFTDDDCRPAAGWLARLLATFEDGAVDAVAGLPIPAGETGLLLEYLAVRNPLKPLPIDNLRSRGPVERLRSYLAGGMVGTELPNGTRLYSAATANLALRRRIVEQVGGFDPTFVGAEDEDLCRRAHNLPQRFNLIYDPAAVVSHDFRGGIRGVLRRSFSYGKSTTRMSAKYESVKLIPFPGPLLVFGAMGLAVRSHHSGLRLAAIAAPCVAYPWWVLHAWRGRRPTLLLLAVLQATEEACAMVGQLHAFIEMRRCDSLWSRPA